MRDKGVKIVCYADNALITPKGENNLQRLLHKLELIAEKHVYIHSEKYVSHLLEKTQSFVTAGNRSAASWQYIIKAVTRS